VPQKPDIQNDLEVHGWAQRRLSLDLTDMDGSVRIHWVFGKSDRNHLVKKGFALPALASAQSSTV